MMRLLLTCSKNEKEKLIRGFFILNREGRRKFNREKVYLKRVLLFWKEEQKGEKFGNESKNKG